MFEKDLERLQGAKFRDEFLTLLYNGDTLTEACAQKQINPGALGLTMLKDVEFDLQIRNALAFRIDLKVDKLENIQDEIDCPIMAGVISKNIQWLASKRNRKLFGEKLDVNHNVRVDLRAAMIEAGARVLSDIDGNALIVNNSSTDNISVKQLEYAHADDDVDPLS